MTRNFKRHPYRIVNRSHQYRFIAMILIYNMIIVGFLAIFLFVPDIIRMQDTTLSLEVRAIAANKILTLHSKVWPVIFLLICLIGLHSFRMFLRTVGPLYRFTVAFNEIRDGNLNYYIKLRDGDYLIEEAAIFNEMLDVIGGKLASIQTTGQDTLQALNKLELDIKKKDGQIEPDGENMTGLRQRLNELVATAGYFKAKQT